MTDNAVTPHRTGMPSTWVVLGILTLLGLTVCILAVGIGSVFIPPSKVTQILVYQVTGLGNPAHWTPIQQDIVWNLRLPRVLLAVIVGAALSIVGVVAQAIMRNPLADPYVLGISSGASLGAVAWIVLGAAVFGGVSVSIAAFAGAMVALLVVSGFVGVSGSFSSSRLVLAGIVIGTGLAGVTNFLIFQANDPGTTNAALFWLLGSLAGARWGEFWLPVFVLIAGILIVLALSRQLNALLFGDATAAALGVDPTRIRSLLYIVAAALHRSLGCSGGRHRLRRSDHSPRGAAHRWQRSPAAHAGLCLARSRLPGCGRSLWTHSDASTGIAGWRGDRDHRRARVSDPDVAPHRAVW